MVNSSLHRPVVNSRLFIGHLGNQDDQQNHHQYADYRPKPHLSASPSTHPSACMVHHKDSPLVALRPVHRLAIQNVSGGSSIIWRSRHRTAATVRRRASWRSAIISVFLGHPQFKLALIYGPLSRHQNNRDSRPERCLRAPKNSLLGKAHAGLQEAGSRD